LELSDGSIVELESQAQSPIPRQGSVHVTKTDGQLTYSEQEQSTKMVYNKIVTPRGGQYQVTLADGTKVWLNASSSLRYPVAFAADERKVELTGEGYFEVAPNPLKPFRVSVHDMQVQVVGTHFNIMSYPEEGAMLTTLLEGEVIVTSPSRGQAKLLPNEQAQLSPGGNMTVIRDVDVDQTVAWKNGHFVFDDTGIETIMRQVSRWYNVDIIYEGDLKDLSFVADVSRQSNVTEILRSMELTGAVSFEIRENTIVVKPGKRTLNNNQNQNMMKK
jgi:ferric-dicitrate binding protein FerR (iron transport regulator)